MINVSDTFASVQKNSYDFEDYTSVSMEIDSWTTSTNDKGFITGTHTSTMASAAVSIKDDTIINLFSQSIELFGGSMAPWPASKSIPGQVAGIFLTSESTSPKDEPESQSQPDANKSQLQSKLRRSTSTTRRVSITRINEEYLLESQRIYSELEPIPIVASDKSKKLPLRKSSAVSAKDAENTLEAQKERKSSRLQNWLSSFYSRTTGNNNNNNNKITSNDEEVAVSMTRNFDKISLKGILKKSSPSSVVQKSVVITENEVSCMSSTPKTETIKKTMKLRFDNEVSICETFHKEDYSRQSLDYVARQLTPSLALQIKKELNTVKQEMEVHDDARHLTQFYLIK